MKTSDFILPFLLIAVILTLIKFSQVVSRKLKLPDVLGELVVGIIIGPTVLGILFLSPEPSSSLSLFLDIDQNHLDLTASIITFISDLAILLLLFKVGIEVDFNDLKKMKVPATLTAGAAVLLPFIGGVGLILGLSIIPSLGPIFTDVGIWEVAIFLGIVLTATSIGISTRLLCDFGKIRTRVAQTVVGAAIIDDVLAVSIFSIITAFLTTSIYANGIILPMIIANICIFFIISYVLYKYALPFFFEKTKGHSDKSLPVFVSIAFMLYMAILAQVLSLSPIIGAFVAGIIIGNEDEYLDIHTEFEPVSSWIIPFFFLTIGLGVNLLVLVNMSTLIVALLILFVAIITKYLGGVTVTSLLGYSKEESQAVGLSMSVRGEVALLFAFSGFSLGFFSEALYGAIILSIIIAMFILIPLMRKQFQHLNDGEGLCDLHCADDTYATASQETN
jgi:Kef-type K+ transport system membrane component KefB